MALQARQQSGGRGKRAKPKPRVGAQDEEEDDDAAVLALRYHDYSPFVRASLATMDRTVINLDLIVELLRYIDEDEEEEPTKGAVLIFLPGLQHISTLFNMLSEDDHFASQVCSLLIKFQCLFLQ